MAQKPEIIKLVHGKAGESEAGNLRLAIGDLHIIK